MLQDTRKLAALKGEKKYSGFDLTSMVERPCRGAAVLQVRTEWGYHWVCNDCIKRLGLKIGSKIRVHRESYRYLKNPIADGRIAEVIQPK